MTFAAETTRRNTTNGMDDGNIEMLPVVSELDHDPDLLLRMAAGQLAEVVIIGFTHDGDEYFKSSKSDGGDVLWCIERAKHKLISTPETHFGVTGQGE